MRIRYVPIILGHQVSGSRQKDVHNEIRYGIFHKKIKQRIGNLSILSHILDPYTQRKHEHNTFFYQLRNQNLVIVWGVDGGSCGQINFRVRNENNRLIKVLNKIILVSVIKHTPIFYNHCCKCSIVYNHTYGQCNQEYQNSFALLIKCIQFQL